LGKIAENCDYNIKTLVCNFSIPIYLRMIAPFTYMLDQRIYKSESHWVKRTEEFNARLWFTCKYIKLDNLNYTFAVILFSCCSHKIILNYLNWNVPMYQNDGDQDLTWTAFSAAILIALTMWLIDIIIRLFHIINNPEILRLSKVSE
jgi:hypothetical protein